MATKKPAKGKRRRRTRRCRRTASGNGHETADTTGSRSSCQQGAGAGQRLPDHRAGSAARAHRRLAEGRSARADAAGGLPPAREDHALRPRADPRACRARPRRRRARRRSRRYGNVADITCADFLQPGASTPVFTRFSTVVGSRGSADTVRDVRGFAVKFYTDEGVFDLVGNNIPVFFIRDGIKFPDLIHAAKPEPDREIPQAQTAHTTFWDFVSLIPESPHMLMWVMSDRAIPRSYRMMEGFGVHTFRLVNATGETIAGEVPLEAGARRRTASCGTRRRRSPASTPTSTAATSATRSAPARSRSGSSACR